jgi:hypothetical protein
MPNKCLIIYQSKTGNTAKVADRFRSVFQRKGWQCDVFNIDKKTDIANPPFDFKNYDFVCLGSGLLMHGPYSEILALVRRRFFGIDPRVLVKSAEDGTPIMYKKDRAPGSTNMSKTPHGKIVVRDDSPKAVVFITYAGYDFGPKEAEPALQLLELEIEHLRFKCIGRFSCPGKSLDDPPPDAYHEGMTERPNEKDLMKAEMFIEEKLEEIADRTLL